MDAWAHAAGARAAAPDPRGRKKDHRRRARPVGHVGWAIQGAALAPDASYLAVTGAPGNRRRRGLHPTGSLDATLGVISLADGRTLWETTIP